MAVHDRSFMLFHTDTHGGNEFGLLNPDTIVTGFDWDMNGTMHTWEKRVRMSASQTTLWDYFTSDVKEFFRLADGCPVVGVHLGDPTQGDKYPGQMAYSDPFNQTEVAIKNWEPILAHENVKNVRLVWGTSLHEYQSSSQKIIARDMRKAYPRLKVKTYGHGLVRYGHTWFDLAHHGPSGGIRTWTEMNVFKLYCQDILDRAVKTGAAKPHVVVRGHFHQRGMAHFSTWFNDRVHTIHGLLIPSFQVITGHAVKVT
ncbi:MAG: hypothetical protein JRD89_18435, partial [Deltaproteobacteria bacterium]|nr:hypothetical protein [Deltaproteobacteria bacterium]